LLDQYQQDEGQRPDLLAAVSAATVAKILGGSLPAPQVLAAKLGPAALEGHISAWAKRPDEESFLGLVGMDNALPSSTDANASADGLAVVDNNASGNKIDNFLQRSIDYAPVYTRSSGTETATLTVTLKNTAPSSGYPDYVIGNTLGIPSGTNRTILSVYTRLAVSSFTVDGVKKSPTRDSELGWNVYSRFIDIPPGGTVTVVLNMSGRTSAGSYQLLYRPQDLPHADTLTVHATSPSGAVVESYTGQPKRRSVIAANKITAWTP
ncbi:MAG TPA: hypothetical protein VGM78_03340, partial [Ilumatobacteraceae bacterium]